MVIYSGAIFWMEPTLALHVSGCVIGQIFCLTSLSYTVSPPHSSLDHSIPNLPKFPIYPSIYLPCLFHSSSIFPLSLSDTDPCLYIYTDRGSVTTRKTDEANCTGQSDLTTHTLTTPTHYFSSTRSLPEHLHRETTFKSDFTQDAHYSVIIPRRLCQRETVRNALPGKKECSCCSSTVGDTRWFTGAGPDKVLSAVYMQCNKLVCIFRAAVVFSLMMVY